jgi:hypothetical protein
LGVKTRRTSLPGILPEIMFYLSKNWLKFVFTNGIRRHKIIVRIGDWRGVSHAY